MNSWRRFWRRRDMDRQLDKELRFHLDQHTEDLIDRGLDPTSAHRQASMALGGLEQVREDCRDARGWRSLFAALQHVRNLVGWPAKECFHRSVAAVAHQPVRPSPPATRSVQNR